MIKPVMYEQVRKWLLKNKNKWPFIADELGVHRSWVSRVANNEYSDPGVNKIEYIHRKYVKSSR